MKIRGITLVELLIAIVLTTIVAFITIQMFTGEQANYTQTRNRIQLQSDAREAMRMLEDEMKNAGYHNPGAVNSGVLTVTPCAGDTFSNGGYISIDSQSTAIAIAIRFYNPMKGEVTCGATNDLVEIDYRWDRSSKILSRKFNTSITTPGAISASVTTGYTPFLEGVDTFSLAFGIVQDRDTLLSPATLTLGAISSGTWNLTTGVTGTIADYTNAGATIRRFNLNLPDIAGTSSIITASHLPWTSTTSEDHLNDSATYRISFRLEVGADALMDAATGLGTGRMEAGFYNASGIPLGTTTAPTTFTFRPSKFNARNIQYDLSPILTAAQKTSTYHFGFKIPLTGNGTIRKVTISNILIVRLNKGRVQNWINASDLVTTPKLMKQVGALKIHLHSIDTKKNGVAYDRTFQVVNNAN